MKKNEKVFCEFRSQRVLVSIWCVLYGKCPILSYISGTNFGFWISVDLTSLHTIEYSTHFLVKKSEKRQNFEKLKNLHEYARYWKSEVGDWKPWVWRTFWEHIIVWKKKLKKSSKKVPKFFPSFLADFGLFLEVNFFKKFSKQNFWSDQTSDSSFHE